MAETNEDIMELISDINTLNSRMDILKKENENLIKDNKEKDDKLFIMSERLDNQKSSIDNLTEQFRDIDGHIELEIDHSQFASKDFVKTELLAYQKLTIDYIDEIRDGGFDEELRDNIKGINTKIEIEAGKIASTISRVERLDGLFRSMSTSVEQTAEAIKSIATDYTLDTVQQRLEMLESFRIQTAGRLEDTVTKTELSEVSDIVTKHESSIVQLADSIQSTVTKTEMDEMSIGSRNLLRHSLVINGNYEIYGSTGTIEFHGDEKRPYARIHTGSSAGIIGIQSEMGVELERGKRYTVSFNFRSTTVNRLNYSYLLDSSGNKSFKFSKILDDDGEWSRYHITFENDISGRDNSRVLLGIDTRAIPFEGYFDISDVKFEEGDKPTSWTAAPEDLDEFLENYQEEVDQEFKEVHEGALGLNETITDAFKDGIITESEANAIIQDRQRLITEKEDIDKVFENLYNNVHLENPEKANLNVKFNAYHQAHNILITSIMNVIDDGKVDAEEVAMVDTNFIDYHIAVAEVREAISEAMIAISNRYTNKEIDNISIGGTNLITADNLVYGSGADGNKDRYITDGIVTLTTDNQYGGVNFGFDKIEPRSEYILHYYYYKNPGSGPVNYWGGLIGGTADASFSSFTYFYDGEEMSGHSFPADDDSGIHKIVVKMVTASEIDEDVRLYIQPNRHQSNHNTMTDVTILDLKLEEGNKPTTWSPSPNDLNQRFTEHESRIKQTEEEIELRVTREVYDENGKLVNEALSALEILADGISIVSSEDGKLSDVTVRPDQIKIRSDVIDITGDDIFIGSSSNETIYDAIEESRDPNSMVNALARSTVKIGADIINLSSNSEFTKLRNTANNAKDEAEKARDGKNIVASINLAGSDTKITGSHIDLIGDVSMVNGKVRIAMLKSANNKTTWDLNNGELFMHNADIVIDNGADIFFTENRNKLYYHRYDPIDDQTRTAGLGFGINVNNRFPFTYLGNSESTSFYSSDNVGFSGFISNTWSRLDANNIQNSVTGYRFAVRENVSQSKKAFLYDLENENVAVLRGYNNGRYNYQIGQSGRPLHRIYLSNQPNIVSDARLKTDITNNKLGLEFIRDIETKVFRLLKKSPSAEDELLQFGFVAQQMERALSKHGIFMEDNDILTVSDTGIYSLQHTQLLAPIVRSIQEVDSEVDQLKQRIEDLENELNKLKRN